ncbi:helix-turn-helix domain-containing protein [Collinsella aerofaciens]|uniref:helix-turn-helix domain-containing protein n=1 Tax=Collinsella aerofaciens TaxID=74426 RepID=UPI00359C23D7
MNVDANKVCGRCLARMRQESGLTQVDIARALGVPQSFVSKVETGERSLKLYEQFDYARALGISAPALSERLQSEMDMAGLKGFEKRSDN